MGEHFYNKPQLLGSESGLDPSNSVVTIYDI